MNTKIINEETELATIRIRNIKNSHAEMMFYYHRFNKTQDMNDLYEFNLSIAFYHEQCRNLMKWVKS